MKKFVWTGILALLFVTTAAAQPAKPYLSWDQVAATLADAQGLTVKYFLDGGATGVALTGVVCTGTTSPFQCTAPWPSGVALPVTSGHTFELVANDSLGVSAKSALIPFGPPATPGNGKVNK